MDKYQKIAHEIISRIEESENILIISSRAPDEDCIASNVVLRWWIEQVYPKVNVDSVIFAETTGRSKISRLPKELNQIECIQASDFNPDPYDIIINVDGNSWDRVFTAKSASKLKSKLNLEDFYQIDHHIENEIYNDIPGNSIQKLECCCAKLIFDYFIKPSDIKIDEDIATWLYFALIDDTGRFVHEVYDDTFEYAQMLFTAGADHKRVVDENMTVEEMKFMAWGIENTDFDEEIKTSILVLDQQKNDELDLTFGEDWQYREIFREGYTEKIKRKVEGFDYGVTFSERKNGDIFASWRTRNYNASIPIQEVLEAIGFDRAGGHFGAGGGIARTMTMKQIIEKFKEEMQSRINALVQNA